MKYCSTPRSCRDWVQICPLHPLYVVWAFHKRRSDNNKPIAIHFELVRSCSVFSPAQTGGPTNVDGWHYGGCSNWGFGLGGGRRTSKSRCPMNKADESQQIHKQIPLFPPAFFQWFLLQSLRGSSHEADAWGDVTRSADLLLRISWRNPSTSVDT